VKKIKTILLVLLAVILFFELFFRIAFREKLTLVKRPQFIADSVYGYRYTPNQANTLRMPYINHKYLINSFGYYAHEFEVEKPKDSLRVILTGSSVLNGLYLNGTEPYCKVLQSEFSDNNYNIEIINCGIDGIKEHKKFVTQELTGYNPDIIFMEFPSLPFWENQIRETYKGYEMAYGRNNPQSREYCVKMIDDMDNYKFYINLYKFSYIFRAIYRIYLRYTDKTYVKYLSILDTNKVRALQQFRHYSFTKSLGLLREISDSLREKNIEFYTFFYGKANAFYINILKQINVPYVELDLYSGDYDFSFVINEKTEGHYNQRAHFLIAEKLYDKMIEIETIKNYKR
jgi:hypothetical protein